MAQIARKRVDSFANRYLDAVIKHEGLPSDYALAQRLKLTHQAISKIRSGRAVSPTTAARIADILKLDALQVIAEIESERPIHDDDARVVWEKLARRVAAGVLVAIGASITPPPASAAPHPGQVSERLCIMSNRRRRWWLPLLPGPADPTDELLT